MEIYITNVFVDDQEKALHFYTNILGFELKNDVPLGENRWLTVTSKNNPDGVELLLEPSGHRAVGPYKHCLLYTSPSPRDISGSRMPSSA